MNTTKTVIHNLNGHYDITINDDNTFTLKDVEYGKIDLISNLTLEQLLNSLLYVNILHEGNNQVELWVKLDENHRKKYNSVNKYIVSTYFSNEPTIKSFDDLEQALNYYKNIKLI